jgi:hypothetical protein
MQRLDGDDVGVDVVTGAVGLLLSTTRTRSGRLGFVGGVVARQSLNCVLRRLPLIYIALCEGGPTAITRQAPPIRTWIESVSRF